MDRKVFEHYRAFYNMVLSTNILSNKSNEEFEKNASNIIDFIGESFKLDSSLVAECKKIILDDLTILSIMADCNALYSTRTLGSKINDAIYPKIRAAEIPTALALNPPMNTPINPCSSTASFTPWRTWAPPPNPT